MTKLPIRRQQVKVQAFLAWLADNGAEVGTPTNPYEVVRYRAYWNKDRAETHIIYAKESGLLTFTGASRVHYERFLAGEPMVAKGEPFVSQFDYAAPDDRPFEAGQQAVYLMTCSKKGVSAHQPEGPTARRRKKLMERDGDGCWFCGRPLGSDVTLEHLVPRSRGGGNDAANCVLAHAKCNQDAANLSISEKVELRAKMRATEIAQ